MAIWQLWLNDEVPDGGMLSFDLIDVLREIGPEAMQWEWRVSGVKSQDDMLEATGAGGAELKQLAESEALVSGSQLAEIATRIKQTIWGEFSAFRAGDDGPFLRVVAFDSSWFELLSEDTALLERIRSSFRDTSLSPLPL